MGNIRIFLVLVLALSACNPMSIDAIDVLCSGIHNKNVEDYCHGGKNRYPAGYCSQSNCHGPDLTGGNTGAPSCYNCHPNKWAVWQSHYISVDGRLHHKDIICSVPGTNVEKCGFDACHGPSLSGGIVYNSGPACVKCHETTPTGCTNGNDD